MEWSLPGTWSSTSATQAVRKKQSPCCSAAFWGALIFRSSFEPVLTWEEADAVLVTPVRHTGEPAICPLIGSPRSIENPAADERRDGIEEGSTGANTSTASAHPKADESEEFQSSEEYSSDEEEDGAEEQKRGARRLGQGAATSPSSCCCSSSSCSSARDASAGAGVGAGAGAGGGDFRSFMFQRRKFILKPAVPAAEHPDGGRKEKEQEDEKENNKKKKKKNRGGASEDGKSVESCGDTFGLVELPVGWPLGRWVKTK